MQASSLSSTVFWVASLFSVFFEEKKVSLMERSRELMSSLVLVAITLDWGTRIRGTLFTLLGPRNSTFRTNSNQTPEEVPKRAASRTQRAYQRSVRSGESEQFPA